MRERMRCARAGLWGLAVWAVASAASAQTTADQRAGTNNGDGMDTHLFRPALDSKGFFSVNGTDIIANRDISFGLVLDYGKNLLRTADGHDPASADPATPCKDGVCTVAGAGSGVDALVANSFQGTFNFNYGLFNRAVVGLSMPVILMVGDAAYQIGPNGGLYNSKPLNAQKIAGMSLHGKLRLLRVDSGLGAAVTVQVGFPFGSGPKDLGADPGFWYWPQLALEKRFGYTGDLKLGLNVGYRGHSGATTVFENDTTGRPQLAEGRFEDGNLVTFGAGISYRAGKSLDLVAEGYGTNLLSNADAKQKLSAEAIGGIKLFVEENSFLMMGAGRRVTTGFEAADLRLVLGFVFEPSIGDRDHDGIKDDEDKCPDEPEDYDNFEDSDGCPDPDNDKDGIPDTEDRCPNVPEDKDGDQDEDGCPEAEPVKDSDHDGIPDDKDKCPNEPEDFDKFEDADGCPDPDNDKDGIPDKKDACPNEPEDFDKFEDEDGCPDLDNDKDQIPDSKDKCPNEPETYNGIDDKDGCPDKSLVVVEGNDIMILQKVQFATNSAAILPASNPILDAVTTVLKAHKEFLVVEVAGHADERGNDQHNLDLTQARARSVVQALVSRGIGGGRLVSQGYGEYCPLDHGSNPVAWEKNRRVEFKIVKTEEGMTNVERGCPNANDHSVFPPKVR